MEEMTAPLSNPTMSASYLPKPPTNRRATVVNPISEFNDLASGEMTIVDDIDGEQVLDDADAADDASSESSRPDSVRSFSSGTSRSTTMHSGTDGSVAPTLARKETAAVNRSKLLVYLVLALAAGGVGYATHQFLSQEEQSDFESQFVDYATEVIESADSNARGLLGKLLSVSNTLTSYSMDTKANWPNVTLPNFDIRTADPFENGAGAELFLFAPIVSFENRRGFEEYAREHQGWIKEDLELRGLGKVDPGNIPSQIYSFSGEYEEEEAHENEMHIPIWQVAPVPTNAGIVMMDLYSHPSFEHMIEDAITARHVLLNEVANATFLANSIATFFNSDSARDQNPRSYAIQPVFEDFGSDSKLVGFVFAVVPWDSIFVDILPKGADGYIVQVAGTCGSRFSYRLDGPKATYLGDDFQPNSDFSYLAQSSEFAEFARYGGDLTSSTADSIHCSYKLNVHASKSLESSYETNKPARYTGFILVVFFLTAMVFVIYDFFVQRRQAKVLMTAQRTTALVSSLFPKSVQQRIMAEATPGVNDDEVGRKTDTFSGKDQLRSYLGDEDTSSLNKEFGESVFKTKPIADFFPETTIMFADIVGFTAWSSTREPSQVFTLLETIYHEFDKVAKKRRVFKVETVGDCYVAVAGLPDPREDHALVMAKFGRQCLVNMSALTKRLEVALGPDTAELGMRVGLHSGPVTAGVLRGERARFQLFGDTMNTASRMESTGKRDKIQISQETADQLIKSGKSRWVQPREDRIQVKGKGEMQTYWLQFKGDVDPSSEETKSESDSNEGDGLVKGMGPGTNDAIPVEKKLSDKVVRLVEWNVDLLARLLKEILSRRGAAGITADTDDMIVALEANRLGQTENALSEVQEIIKLPGFEWYKHERKDPNSIQLEERAVQQLHAYIQEIARMYNDNPFHNFEHASHVTMSVVKLFSRIMAPGLEHVGANCDAKHLFEHTCGLSSDPLTQFSVILSALVHDADHPGVPNTQLVKEETSLAVVYDNKSVAEQNSVDLAWELLMHDSYKELRETIYTTEAEFRRFRQLMVNTVLATDIMDKNLKTLRNYRWDKAFSESFSEESPDDVMNRKATIVLEHLIQASDVAHTMQHWHIYRKWNARLFEELYVAYVDGRSENDPSENWYKGEIGFLDFYVIPLAKKLKDCGIFGVSSAEYLQYAMNNRDEWQRKGEEVVRDLVANIKHGKKTTKPDLERTTGGNLIV